jgi:hypothetical protein
MGAPAGSISAIPLEQIEANPFQPRSKHFAKEQALNETGRIHS